MVKNNNTKYKMIQVEHSTWALLNDKKGGKSFDKHIRAMQNFFIVQGIDPDTMQLTPVLQLKQETDKILKRIEDLFKMHRSVEKDKIDTLLSGVKEISGQLSGRSPVHDEAAAIITEQLSPEELMTLVEATKEANGNLSKEQLKNNALRTELEIAYKKLEEYKQQPFGQLPDRRAAEDAIACLNELSSKGTTNRMFEGKLMFSAAEFNAYSARVIEEIRKILCS